MATNEKAKSLSEIRDYWESAAQVQTDRDGLRPTARDPYLQDVVESAIEKRLYRGAKLLDIGCGDGWSTVRFHRITGSTLGIDYIEEFVNSSRESAGDVQGLMFEQADAMDLSGIRANYGNFDVVTSIRCLINLSSWINQVKAIAEIASCVRPGGLYLTSEGWDEGMIGLNLMRERVGLPSLNVVEYNVMISRNEFEEEVKKYFEIIDYISLGYYLFTSRVLQPVMVAPEEPRHDHPLNRAAAMIQSQAIGSGAFYECDYAGVYVLRRKD